MNPLCLPQSHTLANRLLGIPPRARFFIPQRPQGLTPIQVSDPNPMYVPRKESVDLCRIRLHPSQPGEAVVEMGTI
jgi:hypothetical protein